MTAAARARPGLDTPLAELLEPADAAALAGELGAHTVYDLLYLLPTRYRHRGRPWDPRGVADGERVTVLGHIRTAKTMRMRNRRGSLFVLTVDEGSGQTLDVTFFTVGGLPKILTPGARVMFDGTVKHFRGRVGLSHPEFLVLDGPRPTGSGQMAMIAKLSEELERRGEPGLFDRTLLPIYRVTRGVTSWQVLAAVVTVLRALPEVADPMPERLRREADVIGLDAALRGAHLPDSDAEQRAARRRLRFDEALLVQLYLARRRMAGERDLAAPAPPAADGAVAALRRDLPFELTADQEAVLSEIGVDLARERPMHRLLQGEVGSGKTVLALLAMLQVVDAGRQCVLLAPTEVLATQHHRSITAMLGGLAAAGTLDAQPGATRVVLLTGSMSTGRRRAALLDVVTGEAGIVIGTHAVLQDTVEYHDLGLVVVDEQHRFGVRQRDRLRDRGRGGRVPHLLVMTATPIPRTIAMTVFGDLDVSELRSLPGGRKAISTSVVPLAEHPRWLERVWERIREEVALGRRAYVVCSRIGDDQTEPGDEGADEPAPDEGAGGRPAPVAAEALHEQLAGEVLGDLRVGLVHGRLPTDDKDAAMRSFAAGETDVLVATTVVEVGVDVAEATVMVIMDADRYGVSQLHQLRGRVGRGGLPGLCLLVTSSPPGTRSRERLDAVAATTDGFELARLDLEQRREGDVLGDAQSGVLGHLRLLSVVDDAEVIEQADGHARRILAADPELTDHPGLLAGLERLTAGDEVRYLDRA